MLSRVSYMAVAVARPTIRPCLVHRFVSPRFRLSAYSTSTTPSSVARKPSAIAQRLPDPDTVHTAHRFREFEVWQYIPAATIQLPVVKLLTNN